MAKKPSARTVTLSIKNVPVELANRLKERAAQNHRSLQGELSAILELATAATLTPSQVVDFVRRMGLKTPSESAQMIR